MYILGIIATEQYLTHCVSLTVPSDSRYTYLVNPTTYRGRVVVRSPTCTLVTSGYICPFSHILGDNEQVPPQPNLDTEDNNNDIAKFIVWRNDTTTPYVLITLPSGTTVRAMNIEFLNYPAQNFSVPNLQLYESNNFIIDPSHTSAQRIEFDMLNNSGQARRKDFESGQANAEWLTHRYTRYARLTIITQYNYLTIYTI